jgi:trigger factor
VLNPATAFNNDNDEIGHMLNKPADQVSGIKSDFQYTIDTINHVESAEMNQEFFDKIYGKDNVTSEEAFRERVRSEIADMYTRESDMKLRHDIEDYLLQEVNLKLPDLFLQKWLQTAVEKPLTPEQVDKDYPGYSRGMKLRLIENRIFRTQELKISKEEIQEMARQNILHQFSGYASGLSDDLIQNLVNRYLEKKETVERIIETLSERKVFNYLKSTAKLNTKKVTYDEFVDIVTKHQHQHH